MKPVAYLSPCTNDDNETIGYTVWDKNYTYGCFPVYTEPPKREWVGLSEYQRVRFADRYHIPLEAVEVIEAKLKEKNMTEIPEHWRTEELPMIKPFELEDKIMSVWSTKEDLELFMRQYLDCEKVMSEDEVSNVILGIIELHELRCNELFDTYTKVFKLDKYRE
jgi:hypothetical protein